MRPGGCLFFRRGGPRGRAGALRKHAKVCVLEGAPRARAGARAPKIIVFLGFAIPLENLKENDAFGAFARWFLLPFPFFPLSRFSLSLSLSLRFLYLVLLDLAPPLR